METISPISKTGAAQGAGPSTAKLGMQNISDNYDTFLNLLTVQLQNQDPLNPMDPTQFVAQLAQFSQLEQSVSQTSALENLVALTRANEARAGIDFLGRPVEAVSEEIAFDGTVAAFDYDVTIPGGKKMEVRIFDANDNLVAKLDAANTIGRHGLVWDGEMETGGSALPGVYHAELVAISEDEAKSGGDIIVTDIVKELRYTQSGAVLQLNSGASISPGAVLAVHDL
ncbi:flagellar hook assembly protein FlgD [Hyphococcus sp.]|jgi:flagellar basal-body rod modification protein FlgD|uniref:flagellar hook assembly protein FlgD n=1 Tax=Hyphococcus sp. TaxID=2038636 RepID=UPI003D0DEDB4